jgi:hypothetical protein
MSDARQQKAINGAACAPLSREQKMKIAILAERAWTAQGCPLWEPDQDPSIRLCRTSALELWRHEEQEHVTGRKHLTACGQGDYELLLAHFSRLAGLEVKARDCEARRAGDDARRARAALEREIAVARHQISDVRAYVAVIARAKYKTTELADLTPKQIWTLLFDLRRAVVRRKQAAAKMEKAPF